MTDVFNGVGCSVFLNNRYMDPATGVFLTVDPLVGKTGDPYLYANGNPVHWTDADGSTGSLDGDAIVAAVEPLLDGSMNPDGEFVRSIVDRRPAHPDFETALAAHRIVDAMYRSAAALGTPATPATADE